MIHEGQTFDTNIGEVSVLKRYHSNKIVVLYYGGEMIVKACDLVTGILPVPDFHNYGNEYGDVDADEVGTLALA